MFTNACLLDFHPWMFASGFSRMDSPMDLPIDLPMDLPVIYQWIYWGTQAGVDPRNTPKTP
jgi:hypothetical protein